MYETCLHQVTANSHIGLQFHSQLLNFSHWHLRILRES